MEQDFLCIRPRVGASALEFINYTLLYKNLMHL